MIFCKSGPRFTGKATAKRCIYTGVQHAWYVIKLFRVDPCGVYTKWFAGVWRKLSPLLQHGIAASDSRHRSEDPRELIVWQSVNGSAQPRYENDDHHHYHHNRNL